MRARIVAPVWLACLGMLLLAGPAGAQDAATIAQAQAAVEAARSTRAVRALAAPELDAAEEALARALAAHDAGRARAEVEHLAYLALHRATIARMYAREREITRALKSLSAAHALVIEAQALEAAAAERRARALAQRLARFDVEASGQGLLLTPRERWFEADVTPAPRALRAIAEAARLLDELPERAVVVLGYALRTAPHAAAPGQSVAVQAAAPREAGGAAQGMMAEPADLGCVRADVVRAFLISRGVDPRRIVARCTPPPGAPEGSAQTAGASAGETALAILPAERSARAPARPLSAGAPTE